MACSNSTKTRKDKWRVHPVGSGSDLQIHLPLEKFTEPGLYLLFDDGRVLYLTRSFIDDMRRRYLRNPSLLPPAVRQAPAYAPCVVCPEREHAIICHAIPTVFPFLEDIDCFLSFHTVTAVYRPEPDEMPDGNIHLYVARTSVQRALQHVSILSLIYYCEVGRAYFKYFAGVIPLMDPRAIMERVYLNLYWDLRGDVVAIKALVTKMRRELEITVHCQIERLRLFCKNDGFVNAFVLTHAGLQFLEEDMEQILRDRLDGRHAPAVALDPED